MVWSGRMFCQVLLVFSFVSFVFGVDDPIFFSAIKGSMNGNYIAFQAVIANNKVSLNYKEGMDIYFINI